MDTGYYAFIRLIGTAYFKRNLASMVSRLNFETPDQLFYSITGMSTEDHHWEWYMNIRSVIRITSEDQRPPSLTALRKHWDRCCWIKGMWRNSCIQDTFNELGLPETSGWLKTDDGYSIDWEATETKLKIQQNLDFLSKGCKCKSGCKTKRCGCQKKDAKCGEGCECKGCVNLPLSEPVNNEPVNIEQVDEESENESDIESDYSTSSIQSDEEPLQTEVITESFISDDNQMVLF